MAGGVLLFLKAPISIVPSTNRGKTRWSVDGALGLSPALIAGPAPRRVGGWVKSPPPPAPVGGLPSGPAPRHVAAHSAVVNQHRSQSVCNAAPCRSEIGSEVVAHRAPHDG